jgi:hypothetical protein
MPSEKPSGHWVSDKEYWEYPESPGASPQRVWFYGYGWGAACGVPVGMLIMLLVLGY